MAKEADTTVETNTDATVSDTKTAAADAKDMTILGTPASVVNPDGTFVDHWKDILPDDLKAEKSLDEIKNLPDAIKRMVNAHKMVGKNKIPIPNEKSKPEEWDAFYEAGGRPKTQDDYKVKIAEDLKDIFTDERIKGAKAIAHKIGASQKQFAAFMEYDQEQAAKIRKEQGEAKAKEKRDAEGKLRQEFGGAYDERMHVANRIVAEALTDEEEKMAFLEKYGNEPDFIRFASIVGSRMTEHKALIATLTTNTPGEAETKIKELRARPGYLSMNSAMPTEERESITAQIRVLTKQAYPEPAKAGR